MRRWRSSTFFHVLEVSRGSRYLLEIIRELFVHLALSKARLSLAYCLLHKNNLLKLPFSSWVLRMTLLPFFHTVQPIGPSYKYTCLAQFISRGPIGIGPLGLEGDSFALYKFNIREMCTFNVHPLKNVYIECTQLDILFLKCLVKFTKLCTYKYTKFYHLILK